MSMNVPNNDMSNQPAVDNAAVVPTDNTTVETIPTETTVTSTPADVVTTDTVPVDNVQQQNANQQQTQADVDTQVVNTVGQALAEDAITAEDIMTAILVDSLGVSPNAAQQLFTLLLQDVAEDAAQAQQTASQDMTMQQQPPMDNQGMMNA